jgi:hypothetical protein
MAMGENLYSQAMNSMAIGTYNEILGDTALWVETDPLFQIGNGTGTGDRHDAFRVNKNGGTYIFPVDNTYGLYIYGYDLSYGGYFYNRITPENTKTTACGLYSRVYSQDTDLEDAYSGYFTGFVTSGVYHGLYADFRSGPSIDVSEYIFDTCGDTEPGDVVVADPSKDESVVKSAKPYQTSVLGVISTKPHLVMGMDLVMDEETGEPIDGVSATRLALSGRVPVKVTEENGAIEPGDLLTTSSTPGQAMKWTLLDVNAASDFDELKRILAENERRRNAIIGKAVGSSAGNSGTVMVLISLQ